MTVYIDVLFVINFVVNYVLLLITGKIMRREKSYIRLVSAAIIGALYACFMFFPQIKFLYGCAFKIIASFLLILIAYGAKNAVLTVKTAFVFYLSSFLFGGVTLALFYFTDAGLKYGGALNNGIFYFELPWKILFFSCLVAYIAVKTGFAIYKRDKNLSYRRIRVEICRNSAELNALVDTGNLLIDPITNSPVVVAELESVKKLLPGALVEVFREKKENDLETVSEAVKNTDFEKEISKAVCEWQELLKKGIERSVIEQAVSSLSFDENDLAALILRKYYRNLDTEKGVQKTIAALVRAGYGYGEIKDALAVIAENEGEFGDE